MKKITIISLFLILPLKANIIPSISLPDKLSESKYSVRMLRIDARIDYRVETPECKNVKFNDYFFLNENIKDLNDKTMFMILSFIQLHYGVVHIAERCMMLVSMAHIYSTSFLIKIKTYG